MISAAKCRTISAVFMGADWLRPDLISAIKASKRSIKSNDRGKARRRSVDRRKHETMLSTALSSFRSKSTGRLVLHEAAENERVAVSLALLTKR